MMEERTFEVVRTTTIDEVKKWRVTFVKNDAEWTMHLPNAAEFTQEQLEDALSQLKKINNG